MEALLGKIKNGARGGVQGEGASGIGCELDIAALRGRRPRRDLTAWVFASSSLLFLLSFAFFSGPGSELALLTRQHGKVLIAVSQILLAVYASVFVWRIALFIKYRPAETCGNGELPTCTVVVPAYNEGRQVLETIRSIVHSDYPAEKLAIIAVDDGSSDDTWFWLKAAAKEWPGRVLVRRLPVNRGKRTALYEGFRRGKGQVFVTIDSDSQVENQTIRRLVSPFCRDPRVGAVAGNVRVLNRREGLIPKMLEVSFAYSFDFIRAGQSVVNSVLCTPGALSAYRRENVLAVLPRWLNQTFCGRPANIGEDRALTNLILRSGFHAHYQRNAIVYTKVPIAYRNLCRMFLRWARSNIRETIVMSGFAFTKFRDAPATGARINLLMGWLSLTAGQLFKLIAAIQLIWIPPYLFGSHLLLGAGISALAPAILYAVRHRSLNGAWAWPYSIFWLFGLSWIGLYALMTPQKNGWLTRRPGPAGGRLMPPSLAAGRRGVPAKARMV